MEKHPTTMSTLKRRSITAELIEMRGYVQNVSPVKKSRNNNGYFKSVVQYGKDDFRDVVVFTEKLYTKFNQAERTKSPVKLSRCTVTPSLEDAEKMDAKFGGRSDFSFVENVGFKYRPYVDTKVVEESVDKSLSVISTEESSDQGSGIYN